MERYTENRSSTEQKYVPGVMKAESPKPQSAKKNAAKAYVAEKNFRREKGGKATQSVLRTLSDDPNKAMQEMMQTIDELRSMYEQESEVLKHGDVNGFMALQEHKLKAAYQYQSDMQHMLQRSDELKSKTSSALMERLKESYVAFKQVSEKNARSLERMDRIMGRISQRLVNAAKRAVLKDSVSYSAAGTLRDKARNVVSTGVIESA